MLAASMTQACSNGSEPSQRRQPTPPITERENSQGHDERPVYDRVNESGTIRCAYVVYPPSVIAESNKAIPSGLMVDIVAEVAKNLKLKVEWVGGVGWASMIDGLEEDRYDLVVSGIWPNAERARNVDFSIPLFYSGICVFVRQNDYRFNNDRIGGAGLKGINNKTINIATIPGEMSDIIARQFYQRAEVVSPKMKGDVSLLLKMVAENRADVTFVEPYVGFRFLEENPGTVKNLTPNNPIRVFGNTVMFKRGQAEFKAMLNTALEELLNSGMVDRLLDRYEEGRPAFYRVNRSYRAPI